MIKITEQVFSFRLPRRERDHPSPLISGIMCNTYCSFTQRDEITAHASRTAPLQKKDTFPGGVVSYKQGTNEVERKSPNRGPVIGVETGHLFSYMRDLMGCWLGVSMWAFAGIAENVFRRVIQWMENIKRYFQETSPTQPTIFSTHRNNVLNIKTL
ncbi:hypothetical protein AVEN_43446-1 [Araneus ventricosus]|uniref:Uncharacterized protein n=1 Tax=Araneus ventricosus TaxID=182803 RepID=A0A4Y2JJ85_ARAVE|nr:hypothetical protein AVEN_43446-1 [Araneus ventricosus]